MKYISARYPFADQDLINRVLHDEICTLPIQYNVNPRAMQFTYKQLAYVYGLNEDNYYTEHEFRSGLRNGHAPVVFHCAGIDGRLWEIGSHNVFATKWNYYFKKSSWYKTYMKKKYELGMAGKIQYWLYRHLPRNMFVIILENCSRWAMVKMVKEYKKYQKNR